MITVICFSLAAVFLILSILQFAEKGFCFNNAYILASKEERRTMDKKPHYRQSAVVFALLFCAFVLIGFYTRFPFTWMIAAAIGLAVVAVIYAILSGIKGSKHN